MVSIRGFRRGVTVVAIAIFLVGWVVVLPPTAAKGNFVTYDAGAHRYTVSPTGTDDTTNIQAAFDGCAADGSWCTIQLTSGTFYTAQIVAWSFHGSFQGMGEAKTIVRALPNLSVSKDHPFNLNLPSADNPWPILFTFLDGTYSISGMTFTEPYAKPTQEYWGIDNPGHGRSGAAGKADALYAIISVSGRLADVSVDQITMVGAPGDVTYGAPFLFNVENGLLAAGLVMEHGARTKKSLPVIPLQVTFRATDNFFSTIAAAAGFESVVGSTGTFSGNTFDTVEWGTSFFYVSQSSVTVSHNTARNVMGHWAVEALQFPLAVTGCQLPTRLSVTDNDFESGEFGGGVGLFEDFAVLLGCAPSLDGIVTGNVIRPNATSFGAVVGIMTRSLAVSGNAIQGSSLVGALIVDGSGAITDNQVSGSSQGIVLYGAQGVLVQGNQVTGCGQWGIAVLAEYHGFVPNNNRVEGNTVMGTTQWDLFWDGTGAGNVWTGNVFQTEYPPGLNT